MVEETNIIETARLWVIRSNSDDMGPSERDEFNKWYNQSPSHQLAFKSEFENWEVSHALKSAFKPEGKIHPSSLSNSNRTDGQGPHQNRGWMQAAAVLTIITFFGLYSWSNDLMILAQADAISSSGEQKQIKLPDGSLATLNTSSAIKFTFSETERHIKLLKGEVFFQVRPDKTRPFRVFTESGLAEAVGTAYSVRKGEEAMTVTVTEGRVSVYSPDTKKMEIQKKTHPIIGPGLQIRLGKGIKPEAIQQVNIEKSLAWRKGKIVFEETPLSEAITELDRYYPGRIIITKKINKSIRISGVFPSNKASNAVRAIAQSNGLSVTETAGGFILLIY